MNSDVPGFELISLMTMLCALAAVLSESASARRNKRYMVEGREWKVSVGMRLGDEPLGAGSREGLGALKLTEGTVCPTVPSMRRGTTRAKSVFAAAAQLVSRIARARERQQAEATVEGHARRRRRRGRRPRAFFYLRVFRSRDGLPSRPIGNGLGGNGDRAEEQQGGAKRSKRHSEIGGGGGDGPGHVCSERGEPAT